MKRALVLAIALLVGCNSSGGGGTTTEPPGNENPPPGPPPMTATVNMESGDDGYGGESHTFAPTAVPVARGGTVTWQNNSGVTHNVTFDPATGAPANISDHSSGSNSRTFSTLGAFSYQCTLHANMRGTVNVAD